MYYFESIDNFDIFETPNAFAKFFKAQKELIVYPVGENGDNFLDFIRYANHIAFFSCIATDKTCTEQKFSHSLPIMPLDMLLHFCESALIIVAAPTDQHSEINQILTEKGFKKIFFLDEKIQLLIADDVRNRYNKGQVNKWFMKNVLADIEEMKYRVAEQCEISSAHEKTFAGYENCFRDRDIVLLGNAPTLKYYKPMPNVIHIGLNRAWLRDDIDIDFLFCIDHRTMDDRIDVTQGFSKIKRMVFLSTTLDRLPLHWHSFPEQYFMNKNISHFYINSCGRYKDQPIYRDICHHALTEMGSGVFSAFQFALYTNPKKIYLAGFDSTPSGHFFDTDEDEPSEGLLNFPIQKLGFARMKMFAKYYYPETEIISINPVGLKGLFNDVYTEEYEKSLSQT